MHRVKSALITLIAALALMPLSTGTAAAEGKSLAQQLDYASWEYQAAHLLRWAGKTGEVFRDAKQYHDP